MSNSDQAHVKVSHLKKCYKLGDNDLWALHDITLDLARGDYVSLCGTSGSGKTTLLNLIGCLDTPTAGTIHIGGRNVTEMKDRELANFRSKEMGFVFQTFNLLPVLTALENVEYPLMKSNLTSKERTQIAQETLDRVGLGKHAHHRPNQLSGGQRQRVAIARAFVHKPELIIADEPTANLDKKTAVEILDLIGDLNTKSGTTTIVATHDPRVMERTRRQVHISDGILG